jgi:spermidine/putrescine transport system permease protein
MRPGRIPLIATAVVLAFFYLPILALAVQSFNASKFGGQWRGFSLRWYAELLEREDIHRAAWNTFVVASVSTLVAMVLGTLAAWVLHRYARSRVQRLHYGLVYAPLVVPDILMGMSLLLFFVNLSVQLSLGTIIVAHITFCLSYVAFVVLARLQDFDDTVIDAARDLGAGWGSITWRILLPLLAPGILAGGLLAFTLSIVDFVITFLVSGPGDTTLPLKIYGMMRSSSPTVINARSVIMMLVTFTIVIISQRITYKQP